MVWKLTLADLVLPIAGAWVSIILLLLLATGTLDKIVASIKRDYQRRAQR